MGRIVAWDELSLFGIWDELSLFGIWDELSLFGIWDELSLGTNCRFTKTGGTAQVGAPLKPQNSKSPSKILFRNNFTVPKHPKDIFEGDAFFRTSTSLLMKRNLVRV